MKKAGFPFVGWCITSIVYKNHTQICNIERGTVYPPLWQWLGLAGPARTCPGCDELSRVALAPSTVEQTGLRVEAPHLPHYMTRHACTIRSYRLTHNTLGIVQKYRQYRARCGRRSCASFTAPNDPTCYTAILVKHLRDTPETVHVGAAIHVSMVFIV